MNLPSAFASRGVVVPSEGFHVAFRAPSREAADAFQAALAHGGRDNGGVGFHPEHGPNYFAAFFFILTDTGSKPSSMKMPWNQLELVLRRATMTSRKEWPMELRQPPV